MISKLAQTRGFHVLSLVLIAGGLVALAFGLACQGGGSGDKSVVISSVTAPSPAANGPRVVNNSPATRLQIDSLGVNAPIMTLGLDANRVPEVPNYQNTSNAAAVVAWYDFSAVPGAGSNAVFAGHVTWDGRAVFYKLDQMKPGDTVKVGTQDGKTLIYEVYENLLVPPTRVDLLGPTDTNILTLITCGGEFTTNRNDPFGGQYDNRVVVRARLLNVA